MPVATLQIKETTGVFIKVEVVIVEINGIAYESKIAESCKKCCFYPCDERDHPPICVDVYNKTVIWFPANKETVKRFSKLILN